MTYRGAGMIVHVDSKPLALSFSSLVVSTAQGDVDYHGRPFCDYMNYRGQAAAPTKSRCAYRE